VRVGTALGRYADTLDQAQQTATEAAALYRGDRVGREAPDPFRAADDGGVSDSNDDVPVAEQQRRQAQVLLDTARGWVEDASEEPTAQLQSLATLNRPLPDHTTPGGGTDNSHNGGAAGRRADGADTFTDVPTELEHPARTTATGGR
jgi:hypothetical protein